MPAVSPVTTCLLVAALGVAIAGGGAVSVLILCACAAVFEIALTLV